MDKFKKSYFEEEISRFMELIGSKKFWNEFDSFQRLQSIRGISYVAMNCCGENLEDLSQKEKEEVTEILTIAIDEYHRRESLLLFGSLPNYA